MNLSVIKTPYSLAALAEKISMAVQARECFILLSGDSGSGRTSLCEQIVNSLEEKMHLVFVPCQSEMPPEKLREIFLLQLYQSANYDLSLPLCDILMQKHVPVKQKILIVVDDADKVVDSFYEELLKLYRENLGRNRFSFVLTGHPLWVQSKLKSSTAGSSYPEEEQMPSLDMEEAMGLCSEIFKSEGLSKIYDAIEAKLPLQLEGCGGNIGRIVELTERLMSEPKDVNELKAGGAAESAAAVKPKKKKRGLAIIIISVICLLIVVGCLTPLFLGGNFFGLGGGGAKVEQVSADELEEDLDAYGIEDDFGLEGEESADGSDEGEEPKKDLTQMTDQERLSRYGEVDNEGVDTPVDRGSADRAVQDDSPLLEDVAGGVEAKTPEATTTNSVTLSGEDLEKIEGESGAKASDRPRPAVAGSVDNKASEKRTSEHKPDAVAVPVKNDAATKEETKPETKRNVLSRADNAIRMEEKRKEEEKQAKIETAKRKQAERAQAEAEEKARKEEAKKAEAARKAEEAKQQAAAKQAEIQKAAQEAAQVAPAPVVSKPAAASAPVPPSPVAKDSQKKAEKAQTKPGVIYRNSARPSSKAVAGSLAELAVKNPNHYTLQVVASHDKSAVSEVAGAVDGRYWVYETVHNGRPWFVLILGDAPSPNEAMRLARTLPAALRVAGPFAKTFDQVQQELKRAQ